MKTSGMNPNGTGATQITDSETAKTEPTWSPDGTRIAYVASSFDVDRNTDLEIWAIIADGSGRKQLTDNTQQDWQPAWSPDGDSIVHVSAPNTSIDRDIYAMDANVVSSGRAIASGTPAGRGGQRLPARQAEERHPERRHRGGHRLVREHHKPYIPVNASLATDFATGGAAAGSDLLSYVERLTGTAGDDTLTVADSDTSRTPALNASNVLKGLGGNDTLDAAEAGDPNDVGNDRVDGGTGSDTCQTDVGDTARNCP